MTRLPRPTEAHEHRLAPARRGHCLGKLLPYGRDADGVEMRPESALVFVHFDVAGLQLRQQGAGRGEETGEGVGFLEATWIGGDADKKVSAAEFPAAEVTGFHGRTVGSATQFVNKAFY